MQCGNKKYNAIIHPLCNKSALVIYKVPKVIEVELIDIKPFNDHSVLNFMVLFFNLAKYCKKELKMRHPLPYFLINFSGVIFNLNFVWDGKFILG